MIAIIEFWNEYGMMLIQGIKDTLFMTLGSVLAAYLFGLPMGMIAVVTASDGIAPVAAVNKVLDAIINMGRSIPFIILLVAVMPFTRAIIGTTLGPKAALVPLTLAAIPFVARLVETSFREVDQGVIEAARAMGASNAQIILKVMLVESLPTLVLGAALTTVTLVSYTAMAGTIGAGGLGDIAIRYGYHRYEPEVMVVTIILLVVIVQIIQSAGNKISNKLDKRKRIELSMKKFKGISSVFALPFNGGYHG